MSEQPVRILVVDDTVVYRKVLSDILTAIPGVEVVGVAANGAIALRKCEQLRPDLLTLDLEMPEMDGLEVLRRLRESGSDTGVIMLSAFTTRGADATIAALKLGAFDFVVKPTATNPSESVAMLRRELTPMIDTFARTRRVREILQMRSGHANTVTERPPAPAAPERAPRVAAPTAGKCEVVAIGVSTGGPPALATMLPHLPADLETPVLIVQHMPALFTRSLADSLNEKCPLNVREAADGECVRAGDVLIAPGGRHMKLERARGLVHVRITDDPAENSCRPAVDYLFRSVAEVYGAHALGVIMTGMGSDGTLGCRLMKRKGATIVAQDEATCVVYGMPRMIAEEGLADIVVPLDQLADEIARLVEKRMAKCK